MSIRQNLHKLLQRQRPFWRLRQNHHGIFCRFHGTVKSLHFETIAWQSKELQKHYRFYAILPLWKGNTAGDAFLQYNHTNRITVCHCTCNSRHHTMPSSNVQRQRAQLGASETWHDTKGGVYGNNIAFVSRTFWKRLFFKLANLNQPRIVCQFVFDTICTIA